MHDTTVRTYAARIFSGFAYGRAFHQACEEPSVSMPQFFFRYGIEPRTVVTLRPGGGDPP